MLTSQRAGRGSPAQLGEYTGSITVFVPDVDGQLARAKAAGATIVEELNETFYGEQQFAATDLEGHHWLFSRHARHVAPAEWGAA